MDDVAVEVIEAKLLSSIDDIFSPVKVYQMSPELVSRIAGKSEDSRTEREQLNRQLAVLRNELHKCKRFAGPAVSAGSVHWPRPTLAGHFPTRKCGSFMEGYHWVACEQIRRGRA
jgi:hypothetical protein